MHVQFTFCVYWVVSFLLNSFLMSTADKRLLIYSFSTVSVSSGKVYYFLLYSNVILFFSISDATKKLLEYLAIGIYWNINGISWSAILFHIRAEHISFWRKRFSSWISAHQIHLDASSCTWSFWNSKIAISEPLTYSGLI